MNNKNLNDLFINELEGMYSSENLIVEALPKMIKAASLQDLRDALSDHLNETEMQVTRLETIFSIMEITPTENKCEAMEGIIADADEMIKNATKSSTLDAAIISAAQKVEHYEIASYGTLKSFAKHLGLDSEIVDLLQDTLDEESSADKKLTTLANGSFFSTGINQEAADGKKTPAKSKR